VSAERKRERAARPAKTSASPARDTAGSSAGSASREAIAMTDASVFWMAGITRFSPMFAVLMTPKFILVAYTATR